MPSIEIQVAASGDDWANKNDGWFGSTGEVVWLGYGTTGYNAGWRFENVAVPNGATITAAFVKFKAYQNGTGPGLKLICQFEDADNPTAPTSLSDNNSRARTDYVSWGDGLFSFPTWVFGEWYSTPDLTSIFQSVIDRPGWVSGNAVNFFAVEFGGLVGGIRYASTWDQKYSIIPPYELLTESYAAKLVVRWATFADLSDETAVNDSIDAFSLTGTVSGHAQAGDEVDWQTVGISAEDIAANDSAAAEIEWNVSLIDGAGISDAVAEDVEIGTAAADAAEANDSTEGFNWTAWRAANIDRAVVRYYCTITGAPDLATDLEVAISSFQARKRAGYSTYVSAIIPGMEYYEEILARPNGEMIIDMAYLVDGIESLREEILRADIEQINIYEGPRSRSINIIGHNDQTFISKVSRVYDPTHRSQSVDGEFSFVFAAPDLYLTPGDTVQVGNDSFTADTVVYLVSASGGQTSMEVQE